MTNGDRIRAMTDEELAGHLEYITNGCDYMVCVATKFCDGSERHYCLKAWLKWLKEEVDE